MIASPVYFSNEKWQECLASHGLIVDKEARTLTVQSEKVAADMVYDLTKEETAVLTSNSIEEQPVEKRLEVLNGVIRADFADKVTMADLDSERRIALGLHPEVQEELTQRQQQEQEILSPLENQLRQEMPYGATASVDGRDISVLDERKGWYREERHGREVEVGEIAVHPSPIEGKYKMTAVIDGQVITHEISQKDYDKFLAVDGALGDKAGIKGLLLAGLADVGFLEKVVIRTHIYSVFKWSCNSVISSSTALRRRNAIL